MSLAVWGWLPHYLLSVASAGSCIPDAYFALSHSRSIYKSQAFSVSGTIFPVSTQIVLGFKGTCLWFASYLCLPQERFSWFAVLDLMGSRPSLPTVIATRRQMSSIPIQPYLGDCQCFYYFIYSLSIPPFTLEVCGCQFDHLVGACWRHLAPRIRVKSKGYPMVMIPFATQGRPLGTLWIIKFHAATCSQHPWDAIMVRWGANHAAGAFLDWFA